MWKSRCCEWLENFLDGSWQWCEILMVVTIPICFFHSHITDIIQVNEKVRADGIDLLLYYAVRQGDFAVGLLLTLLLIKFFYKINERKLLNAGIRYHDHSMVYYRLCAILLGYKQCSLVRVPIPMQFCLIMNDCFDEYYTGDDEAYDAIENEKICSQVPDLTQCGKNINLCIEDTYPLKDEYIPTDLRKNTTIKISRYVEGKQGIRCYSRALVAGVTAVINSLPDGRYTVYVMATTNVKNTVRIAQDVFKTGGRSNIEHLFVYTQAQGKDNIWKFSSPTKVF